LLEAGLVIALATTGCDAPAASAEPDGDMAPAFDAAQDDGDGNGRPNTGGSFGGGVFGTIGVGGASHAGNPGNSGTGGYGGYPDPYGVGGGGAYMPDDGGTDSDESADSDENAADVEDEFDPPWGGMPPPVY